MFNERENVLAIHGLNLRFSDTDFLVVPESAVELFESIPWLPKEVVEQIIFEKKNERNLAFLEDFYLNDLPILLDGWKNQIHSYT